MTLVLGIHRFLITREDGGRQGLVFTLVWMQPAVVDLRQKALASINPAPQPEKKFWSICPAKKRQGIEIWPTSNEDGG
jgi:hypothetical protein